MRGRGGNRVDSHATASIQSAAAGFFTPHASEPDTGHSQVSPLTAPRALDPVAAWPSIIKCKQDVDLSLRIVLQCRGH